MKHPIDFLKDSKLLKSRHFLYVQNEELRGLFIGVYHKDKFKNIDDFCIFTQNISSITQDWYQLDDIEQAYRYYYPPEGKEFSVLNQWKKEAGSLRNWVRSLGVLVDYKEIPDDLSGDFYWDGSKEDFGVIGENANIYFECFIADSC